MRAKDHRLTALDDFLSAEKLSTDLDTLNELRRFVERDGDELDEEERQRYYWLLHRIEDLFRELQKSEDLIHTFRTKLN